MRIDPRTEVMPMLEMFSRRAHRLAGEAGQIAKEATTLTNEIDGLLIDLQKEFRKPAKWWEWWKR